MPVRSARALSWIKASLRATGPYSLIVYARDLLKI